MPLTGRAGEHGAWPMSLPPAAGKAGQPGTEQVAREVLGGHPDGALGPAIAEVAQVGHEDLAKGGLHGEVGEQAVQHGLGGGPVELVKRVPQLPGESGEPRSVPGSGASGRAKSPAAGGVSGCRWCDRGAATEWSISSSRAARAASAAASPRREVGLHPADPLLVGTAVQAEPARRTHRLEQAVAALPRAQQVLAHRYPTRKFPDAQDRRIALTRHDQDYTDLGQEFDSSPYRDVQSLDKL